MVSVHPAEPDSRRVELRQRLLAGDPTFWSLLREATGEAQAIDELLALATLRARARARGLAEGDLPRIRLALLGAYALYPLHCLVEQLLFGKGYVVDKFVGEFDSYAAELLSSAALVAWRPDVVFVLPSGESCRYPGPLTAGREKVQGEAVRVAEELLDLCRAARKRNHFEIILGNFALPSRCDLGEYRGRAAASDWTFRKLINLELGLRAPSFVHLCDLEHLAYRIGALAARDERLWFESKQPGSAKFILELAREIAHGVRALRTPPRKVLVLDLDNTLWGGNVGDLGVEGIEIGTTSPRGEAYRDFQRFAAGLRSRGILLAVCSKNDQATAIEPFDRHPEMILRRSDFAAFKANWEPKTDNLRAIALELGLGLDSLVFVDDNPAEVEIVRRFAPEVEIVLLGEDPSTFVAAVQERRFFEPATITDEDLQRADQYRQEVQRNAVLLSTADMDEYLRSLDMKATVQGFRLIDVSRIAQLINKSNQFNLTTRRRTEAEVSDVMSAADHVAFSIRLADRFGDHGLIAVVIGRVSGTDLVIDTWLMSCRVLKRQVELETLNELARVAREAGCTRLVGTFIPTAKNGLVRDLYPSLGFQRRAGEPSTETFELSLQGFHPTATAIDVRRDDDQR